MKTILITGSSRGIGRATAKLAAKKGYKVIVHGRTDSEALSRTHQEIEGAKKTFFDLADKQATHTAIKKLGHVDILVCNAGMGKSGFGDISEIDDEQAVLEYRNNVLGTLHCIQAVLPAMVEKGEGSVVCVSSIKGHDHLTTLSSLPYGLTKSGVLSMSKALAKAYAPIRFNTVSPGYTETDMASSWSPETFDKIKKDTLAERIGQPEEIAQAILFLASNDSSYISGIDLIVDGGFAIKGK